MPGQLRDPAEISGTKGTADVTGSRLRNLHPPSLHLPSPPPPTEKCQVRSFVPKQGKATPSNTRKSQSTVALHFFFMLWILFVSQDTVK